jgi:peptidoglycan/LPS O-acetylase OafA/YrhL
MPAVRHENNFDVLRLLAAMLVIFSHSFDLCHRPDIIQNITGKLAGGAIAVNIFFTISGYLIAASWCRSKEIIPFFEKRILRIYPALIVVVLLSMFVFGPILTSFPLREYFTDRQTYTYLINLSLWKLQFPLPGVIIQGRLAFFNAPIWTLFFEFLMYVLTAAAGLMGMLEKKSKKIYVIWGILIPFIILRVCGIPEELFILKISANNFVTFFIYYFTGVLYYYYRKNKKFNGAAVTLLLVAALATRHTPVFFFFTYLFITSFVFWFSFASFRPLKSLTSHGDFSYGLYIYGCIVQHFINYNLDCSLPLWVLTPLTILSTFPFAIFSWYVIEKRALNLKLRI